MQGSLLSELTNIFMQLPSTLKLMVVSGPTLTLACCAISIPLKILPTSLQFVQPYKQSEISGCQESTVTLPPPVATMIIDHVLGIVWLDSKQDLLLRYLSDLYSFRSKILLLRYSPLLRRQQIIRRSIVCHI